MVIIGTLIRGPGWMWFWPGQTWDHNRLVFEVNQDLPEMFGITGAVPAMIFGFVVLALFVVVCGLLVHKLMTMNEFNRKILGRMSLTQYIVMQVLLITMMSLPAKMIARLVFRVKDVLVTPWFNI